MRQHRVQPLRRRAPALALAAVAQLDAVIKPAPLSVRDGFNPPGGWCRRTIRRDRHGERADRNMPSRLARIGPDALRIEFPKPVHDSDFDIPGLRRN
jgi:hypothetical protein